MAFCLTLAAVGALALASPASADDGVSFKGKTITMLVGSAPGGSSDLSARLFVPFFIVPKLDWLFWSWLKAFIQYSFIPVVAIAFLMVFERFIFRYVTTLPPTITEAEYGVYALQAVAVIVTFCTGILLVPSLTTAIFSGQGGQASFPGLNRFLRR